MYMSYFLSSRHGSGKMMKGDKSVWLHLQPPPGPRQRGAMAPSSGSVPHSECVSPRSGWEGLMCKGSFLHAAPSPHHPCPFPKLHVLLYFFQWFNLFPGVNSTLWSLAICPSLPQPLGPLPCKTQLTDAWYSFDKSLAEESKTGVRINLRLWPEMINAVGKRIPEA